VRLDDQTTLSDVENAPLARARLRLQDAQEKISRAVGIESPPNRGDPLRSTLDLLYARERDGEVRNGRIFHRNSPFSYPEESERERYRRTEVLVNQIRPTPFEIPEYLAMFARELVSIEMVLARPVRQTILIGTVPFCPSNMQVDVILDPDFEVLLVDVTYADFVYQMLKAVVMSWKITSPAGRLPVSMSTKIEDTRETISMNSGLVGGFTRSLERMLREGVPGASTEGAPPVPYHPALSMLGVYQKRFSVAAALARIAVINTGNRKIDGQQSEEPNTSPNALTPAEWIVVADALAALWVFDSAKKLDCVDPTIALQGILLALASQALVERSLAGFVSPEIVPASARAERIADYFLDYVLSSGIPRKEAEDRRRGTEHVAATLDMLWQTATESGRLEVTMLQPAMRWRRYIQQA
jgi:hypothetical protein